jgi:hypothetical protein
LDNAHLVYVKQINAAIVPKIILYKSYWFPQRDPLRIHRLTISTQFNGVFSISSTDKGEREKKGKHFDRHSARVNKALLELKPKSLTGTRHGTYHRDVLALRLTGVGTHTSTAAVAAFASNNLKFCGKQFRSRRARKWNTFVK